MEPNPNYSGVQALGLYGLTPLDVALNMLRSRGIPKGYKGIYTPKIAKLDLTTDTEYVANLVNVNMWWL